MHTDVLVSERLLACFLLKREGESKRAHAPGCEFVVGTALSSTDCEGSSSHPRMRQTASSFQKYCRYQQNVLSWVECVMHASTRTTITFPSRRQSSRFFFCCKAIDMMHLSTCFTTIIRHEFSLHGGMGLEKAKMGVGGPSVRGCPNLVNSITLMDGSGHSES